MLPIAPLLCASLLVVRALGADPDFGPTVFILNLVPTSIGSYVADALDPRG